MARRSQTSDPEALRAKLVELLQDLPDRLRHGNVGEQVAELVNVHHHLRDLGASIGATLAPEDAGSGRARLIAYLRAQVGRIVHTDELMIVAGFGDYPRRIRELRTQHGWPIISGLAVRDMRRMATASPKGGSRAPKPSSMAPEEYLLIEDRQDRDAVRRWGLAGSMRDAGEPVRDIVARYFDASPDARVTAEELRYVAGNSSAWTDAVTELVAGGRQIDGADLTGRLAPVGIFIGRTT
ncbi:MAG: hypothetical protein GC145_07865 [Caulobacter sp.]|nr:hypothetical protein [Caulobacter sp.]